MGSKYRAIYRGGKLLAEYAGDELTYLAPDYSPAPRSDLAMPMVIRDIGEYRSTIDGSYITSRNQHRDHMRAHDVVEVGNDRMSPQAEAPRNRRETIGEIKRHVEKVQAMPQAEYDAHTRQIQAEHAQVATLITE